MKMLDAKLRFSAQLCSDSVSRVVTSFCHLRLKHMSPAAALQTLDDGDRPLHSTTLTV